MKADADADADADVESRSKITQSRRQSRLACVRLQQRFDMDVCVHDGSELERPTWWMKNINKDTGAQRRG